MESSDRAMQTEARAGVTVTAMTGSHFYRRLKEMSELIQLS